MDNQNRDNLENFFKNKFEEPTKKDGWNTPDDFVWENISQRLQRPTSNRMYLLIITWAFLGLLALLSGYLFVQNKQKTESIKELNKKIELCLGNQNETNNENKDLTLSSLNEVSNEVKPKNINIKSSNAQSFTTIFDKLDRQQGAHYYKNNLNKIQDENSLLAIENGKNLENPFKSISALITEKMSQESIDLLKNFEFKHLESNSRIKEKLHNYLPGINMKPKEQNRKQNLTRVGFGYNGFQWFNTQQTKGQLSELILRERYLTSSGLGISVDKQLGTKWMAQVGISYHQRRFDTEYLLNLPYNKNLETMGSDNSFEQIFNHSLPTALGNVTSILSLRRPSSSMINTIEPVVLDFIIENRSDIISVPISFQYHPNGVIKDGLFFSGGLSTHLYINQNIEVIKQLSHHAQISGKSVDLKLEEQKGSRADLGLLLGIGYQKIILPRLNIVVQASYRNTILNEGENIEAGIKTFYTISR